MPVYSHSMVSTYETCPHQFKLKYIEKPDVKKFDGIEAFLGKRVHDALQKLYEELILSKMNTLDDLIAYYGEVWAKKRTDNIVIRKDGYTEQNYFDTGERAIRDYYRRYHPFNSSRILAVEKKIPFTLGGYSFSGVMDRLDFTEDGAYEIHDYKTSGSLPDDDKLENDRQLALYQIGLIQNYQDAKKVRLVWHYLVFDREFTQEKSEEKLREIEARTSALIKTIESDTTYEAKESNLCNWCDYPSLCPAQKHLVKTEAMSVEEFLGDDGVTLANRYVEVSEMMKDLEGERDSLKSRIIAYAKREELTKVRGSDRILNISEKEVLKFPGTKDTMRKDLEDCLRRAGKWDEVSSLDAKSLPKKLLTFDRELREKIEEFGTLGKEVRISIRRIKEED